MAGNDYFRAYNGYDSRSDVSEAHANKLRNNRQGVEQSLDGVGAQQFADVKKSWTDTANKHLSHADVEPDGSINIGSPFAKDEVISEKRPSTGDSSSSLSQQHTGQVSEGKHEDEQRVQAAQNQPSFRSSQPYSRDSITSQSDSSIGAMPAQPLDIQSASESNKFSHGNEISDKPQSQESKIAISNAAPSEARSTQNSPISDSQAFSLRNPAAESTGTSASPRPDSGSLTEVSSHAPYETSSSPTAAQAYASSSSESYGVPSMESHTLASPSSIESRPTGSPEAARSSTTPSPEIAYTGPSRNELIMPAEIPSARDVCVSLSTQSGSFQPADRARDAQPNSVSTAAKQFTTSELDPKSFRQDPFTSTNIERAPTDIGSKPPEKVQPGQIVRPADQSESGLRQNDQTSVGPHKDSPFQSSPSERPTKGNNCSDGGVTNRSQDGATTTRVPTGGTATQSPDVRVTTYIENGRTGSSAYGGSAYGGGTGGGLGTIGKDGKSSARGTETAITRPNSTETERVDLAPTRTSRTQSQVSDTSNGNFVGGEKAAADRGTDKKNVDREQDDKRPTNGAREVASDNKSANKPLIAGRKDQESAIGQVIYTDGSATKGGTAQGGSIGSITAGKEAGIGGARRQGDAKSKQDVTLAGKKGEISTSLLDGVCQQPPQDRIVPVSSRTTASHSDFDGKVVGREDLAKDPKRQVEPVRTTASREQSGSLGSFAHNSLKVVSAQSPEKRIGASGSVGETIAVPHILLHPINALRELAATVQSEESKYGKSNEGSIENSRPRLDVSSQTHVRKSTDKEKSELKNFKLTPQKPHIILEGTVTKAGEDTVQTLASILPITFGDYADDSIEPEIKDEPQCEVAVGFQPGSGAASNDPQNQLPAAPAQVDPNPSQHYCTQPSDTLLKIASRLYYDPHMADVLYLLNKDKLGCISQWPLRPGILLRLPTQQEIRFVCNSGTETMILQAI